MRFVSVRDAGPSSWAPPAVLLLACLLPIVTLGFDAQTGDALKYAWSARSGTDPFHPHHLAFSPAVRVVYLLLATFSSRIDTVQAAQVHNAIWAIALAGFVYSIWRSLGLTARWAGLGAWVLLLTQGVWTYIFMAEMYVPSMACLAAVILLMTGRPPERWSPGRVVAIGVALAAAILYHQGNLLFLPAVAAYLLVDRGRRGLPQLALLTAVSGVGTLAAYVAAYSFLPERSGSVSGFLAFCTDYAQYPVPDWGTWSNVGPRGLLELLRSQAWGVGPSPVGLDLLVAPCFGIAVAALAVWQVRAAARRAPDAPLRAACLTALATFFAFYLWWLPTEKHLFVATLLPLALLVGLAMRDFARSGGAGPRRWSGRLAVGVAVLLVGLNVTGTIVPWHFRHDSMPDEAARVSRELPPDCVVVGRYRLVQHLRYYQGRERIVPGGLPILFRYAQLPPPRELRVADEESVCISLVYLDPAYAIGPYDGYRQRRIWFDYAADLFRLRRGAFGGLEHRRFDVYPGDGDTPFVCIRPETTHSDALREFVADLDRAVDALDPSSPGRFGRWLKADPELAFRGGAPR